MTVPASFVATAYGPPWGGIQGTGTTATGIKLPAAPTGRVGPPYIVAVDPSVIPLGSKLKIWPNPAGDPNIVWTASDTGGAIKGNRIDFLDLAGRSSQNTFGRQPVSVSTLSSSTPGTTTPSASAASGGQPTSSGGPDWAKFMLDLAFLGLGVASFYRGTKRVFNTGKPR